MTVLTVSVLATMVVAVKPGDDLVKTRDFLRSHRTPGETAEVVFEDGVYSFTNGVFLTELDSDAVWRARNPGKVTIVGGRSFRGDVFKSVSNGLVEWTVPTELRTNFLFRSLAGRPTVTGDTWAPPLKPVTRYPILTIGLRTMQLARWPNAPAYHWPKAEDVLRKASKGTNQVLRVSDERVKRWNLDGADIWIYGFQGGCAYEQHLNPVLGYDGALGGFEFGDGRGKDVIRPGQVTRFYFLNVMEEIDRPGEWCYDRVRGVVRMMPPEGFCESSLVALGWMTEPMFRVEGSRIRIQGLTFTAFAGTPVVVVQGGSECAVEGCTFSGLDLDGVFLSGTHNTVQSCDFRDVANICVGVHGGKPRELIGGYNVVDNCHCENFCTMRSSWGRGAIHLFGGVYNRASHNLVHGSTEHGLDYCGFGHVVEYNRIYDVSTEFGDTAATYTGGGFQSYGCIYRYNDAGTAPGFSMAYYADDFSSGHTVYGNIFRNYGYYGAFFGGGRDNVISNNIFTAGWGGTRIDNRGLFWPAYKNVENIYSNVLVKAYDFENGPIAKKWPKFAEWHRRDGKMMCGYWDNVWCNNLYLDLSGYSSSLFVARNRPITDTNRLTYVNNLIVRTKGLPKGRVEMERGAENVPTNEFGAANVVYLGRARILEGTPENPIDLGFRDVPEAMWDASEYMHLAQGWINVPKLQELRAAGKTRGKAFRLGDFSQKPDARIAKEIPGWQEIPFAKIGLYKDKWRSDNKPNPKGENRR